MRIVENRYLYRIVLDEAYMITISKNIDDIDHRFIKHDHKIDNIKLTNLLDNLKKRSLEDRLEYVKNLMMSINSIDKFNL